MVGKARPPAEPSDIDLSAFAPTTRPGTTCAVTLALNLLEGVPLVQARAALAAQHITNKRISVVLGEWSKIKVSTGAVQRHRIIPRECACVD